jgi:beta-lactamase regulating signal transducer with metallopeptidase domain
MTTGNTLIWIISGALFQMFRPRMESQFHYLPWIRILRDEDASALPSTTPVSTIFSTDSTTSTAPTSAPDVSQLPSLSSSNSSTIFLAVGLSVGILLLGVIVLLAFLYIRKLRRRRGSLEVDAYHPTPQLVTPSTTWPVVRKPPLSTSNQYMRDQLETPGVSGSGSDILGATSISLPPSYESHF